MNTATTTTGAALSLPVVTALSDPASARGAGSAASGRRASPAPNDSPTSTCLRCPPSVSYTHLTLPTTPYV